jgi:cyclic dehypoxanthinyl futalosine synthase
MNISSGYERNWTQVLDRAAAGHRLDAGDILHLYRVPMDELAAAANEVRMERSNPDYATYSIGGNIDYTNVCTVACRFCAFYRARHQEDAFTLTIDEIVERVGGIKWMGGGDVLLQGGINPDLPFQWYLDLLRRLKSSYPEIHIDAFSPEEILGLEHLTGRGAPEILRELKDAGLDGMPGAAAEILVDEVRSRTAPTRIKTSDWFRITDAAMQLKLHNPWVGMVIRFGETLEDRVTHLIALREQQDRGLKLYGSGFTAYKVWPARLEHTRLSETAPQTSDEEIASEYLRDVAVGRLALDNIDNHRAVWRTMGFGVAARALQSGANDLCGTGSINAIDACIRAAGKQVPDPGMTIVPEVVKCIEDAGFTAALRDPHYNIITRHESGTACEARGAI